MTGPLCIGVDPGTTGSIALVSDRLLECDDLPMEANGSDGAVQRWLDARKFLEVIRGWSARHDFAGRYVIAVIERPIPMPSMPSTTLASTFDGFGAIRGVLAATRWDIRVVQPRAWKRVFGLKGGKDEKTASRECAARLYPDAPVGRVKDHNRAEAVLLAHYAKGLL